jgi:hypothetical protein
LVHKPTTLKNYQELLVSQKIALNSLKLFFTEKERERPEFGHIGTFFYF